MTAAIAQAWTRELLKRTALPMFLAVFIYHAGPLAILGLIALDGHAVSPTDMQPLQFYLNFLCITFLGFAGSIGAAQIAICRRLQRMPISTRAIVVFSVLSSAALLVSGEALTLAGFTLVFGIRWPWLCPLLVLATASVLSTAACWTLTEFRVRKLLAWILVAVAGIAYVVWRHQPEGLSGPVRAWTQPTLLEAGGFGLVWLAALGVASRGAARWRRGDKTASPIWAALIRWWQRGRDSIVLPTPAAAVDWSAWRFGWRSALVLACVLAVWGLIGQGLAFFNSVEAGLKTTLIQFIVLSGVGGLLLGVAFGNVLQRQPFAGLLHKPIATPKIGSRLLRSLLLSASLYWVVLLALTAIVPLIATGIWGTGALVRGWQRIEAVQRHGLATLLLTAAASWGVCWAAASSVAPVGWTGNARLGFGLSWSVSLLLMAGFLTFRFFTPAEYAETVALLFVVGIAGILACGAALAFRIALRRRLASPAHLYGAGCGLLAALLVAAAFRPPSLVWWALVTIAAVLAVLSLATAPLALAARRHA